MVTIKEIAERAGVSTTTVSNVIHHNTKKVSPENIKKINKLIQEMGYIQRKGFNVLRNDKSQLIAVVVNSHKTYEESLLADPFYGEIIGFIESRLREAGYYMMFYSASDIDDIFHMIMTWDVDGVIAITFSATNCEKLRHFVDKPIIAVDSHCQPSVSSSVPDIGIDNRQGGYIMTKHLLQKGYENILVCACKDYGNDHMRWEGVQDAWRECNYPTQKKLQLDIIGTTWEYRKQYYRELIKHIPFKNKTVAFFMSDYFALEAIGYLKSKGLKIPDDIGIAGFDDLVYSTRWTAPALTTIKQDIRKKAELAVDEMVKMINDSEYEPKTIVLPTTLIERDSV